MSVTFYDLALVKFVATGNDFLLIDLLEPDARRAFQTQLSHRPRPDWVRNWAHRHTGLGADGVVFLESDTLLDFKWDFYNSDGSSAEMCGNAARGVALYMYRKTGKTAHRFASRAGEIQAIVFSEDAIEIKMPTVTAEKVVKTQGGVSYRLVHAGVPHAVVEADTLDDRSKLRALALAVKQAPEFLAHGTNVTFYKRVNHERVQSVTFERGVEDFTLSCGTGAVAAAYQALQGQQSIELQVEVPGGQLTVVFKAQPHLKGPARIIYQARLFNDT